MNDNMKFNIWYGIAALFGVLLVQYFFAYSQQVTLDCITAAAIGIAVSTAARKVQRDPRSGGQHVSRLQSHGGHIVDEGD